MNRLLFTRVFLSIILLTILTAACASPATPTSMPSLPQATATPRSQAEEPLQATDTTAPTLTNIPTTMVPPTSAPPITTPTIEPMPTQTQEPTQPAPTLTPTSGEVPDLERTLSLQDPPLTGDDVLAMQERLLALGYTEVGVPDGVFGAMTDNAVRRFQGDNGLEADGFVGLITWGILFGGELATVTPAPTPTSAYTLQMLEVNLFYQPYKIAYDGEVLWINSIDNLTAIDPESGERVDDYNLFSYWPTFSYSGGLLWFIDTESSPSGEEYFITGISPETAVTKFAVNIFDLREDIPAALLYDSDQLWVGYWDGVLLAIDPDDGKVFQTIYTGAFIDDLLLAEDLLWLTGDSLLALDPESGAIVKSYPFPVDVLTFYGDRIWFGCWNTDTIQSLNLTTGETSPPIALGHNPVGLAYDGDRLWITLESEKKLYYIEIRE